MVELLRSYITRLSPTLQYLISNSTASNVREEWGSQGEGRWGTENLSEGLRETEKLRWTEVD